MPAVTKRTWTNAEGKTSTAYVVSYSDRSGKRRRKQFKRKAAADEFASTVTSAVRDGSYVPDAETITVKEAIDRWIAACERGRGGRMPVEPHTLRVYKSLSRMHIEPVLGQMRLTDLTPRRVKEFRDHDLLDAGRSRMLTKKVIHVLSAVCREAIADEKLGINPCATVRLVNAGRHKERVEIPSKEDAYALISKARQWAAPTGRFVASGAEMSVRPYITRPRAVWFYTLVRFLIGTGARLSEARGAPLDALDLRRQVFTVRQRADEMNNIGDCKSAAAYRELELSDSLCADIEAWLAVRTGSGPLLFGNEEGGPVGPQNIYRRYWLPLLTELGFAKRLETQTGRKHDTQFTIHALRHFHASVMIEHGLQLKALQEHMGHASVQITMDTYGHLFTDDAARAQRRQFVAAADELLMQRPLLEGKAQ